MQGKSTYRTLMPVQTDLRRLKPEHTTHRGISWRTHVGDVKRAGNAFEQTALGLNACSGGWENGTNSSLLFLSTAAYFSGAFIAPRPRPGALLKRRPLAADPAHVSQPRLALS